MPAAVASHERRALTIIRVAGTAVLVLIVAFLAIVPTAAVHENLPGISSPILGFELASTPEHVFGILGNPGEPARADAVRRIDLGNRIDFLFMIAYPALFVGIALLLESHGSFSRAATMIVVALAVLMAIGDALENRELLFLSGVNDGAAMLPSLARLRIVTHVKWYAIFAASGLLAAGAWRERGWWRWSAPFYALAALGGVASLAYLAAIEAGMNALALAWVMTYVRSWRA
ncbi:MAG: hypothetical protein HY271_09485 [Deltaproteobacteria bacterium]|nr:hypothetical protein [Deltaproteobacteria bacterium]